MMVYEHAFGVFGINNWWSATASLVNDNDVSGIFVHHCLSFVFFMNIRTFLNKMNIQKRFVQAQCHQSTVYDNSGTEAIRVLVGNYQCWLLS